MRTALSYLGSRFLRTIPGRLRYNGIRSARSAPMRFSPKKVYHIKEKLQRMALNFEQIFEVKTTTVIIDRQTSPQRIKLIRKATEEIGLQVYVMSSQSTSGTIIMFCLSSKGLENYISMSIKDLLDE